MWKKQILDDIEKLRFNPNKLFIDPNTNSYITREQYIENNLDSMITKHLSIIKQLNGLEILTEIEKNPDKKHDKNQLNCSEELAKSILTYIYWKYKNPMLKLNGQFNMGNLIIAVGITKKPTETIIEPISFNSKCYMCGGDARISIPSYANKRIIFQCQDCVHFYETAPAINRNITQFSKVPYIRCNCTHCSSIKDKIFKKGIQWFDDLKNTCAELVKKLDNRIIGLPDDKIMKQHFETYISQNKHNNIINIEDIKKIINYNAYSTDELADFINSNSDYFNLVSNLRKNNIIYDVKQEKHLSMESLLMDYILGGTRDRTITYFREFSKYITEGDFLYTYVVNNPRNPIGIMQHNNYLGHIKCENFNITNDIQPEEIKKYLYKNVTIINHYFSEYCIENYTFVKDEINKIATNYDNPNLNNNDLIDEERKVAFKMNDNLKLELKFSTPNSYIFSSELSGISIEIHIHINSYQVIHITIIISDSRILIQKDRKFLNYIDKIMLELDTQFCNIFGLLTKGYEAETYFCVNFNSQRFNFPPCFLRDSDEYYQNVKHNLSKIIFKRIEKLKIDEIF